MNYTFKLYNSPSMEALAYFRRVKKAKKLSVLVYSFKWHRFTHSSLGYSFISRWKKRFWVIKSFQSNRGLNLYHKSKFIKGAKYRSKLEQKRILREKKESDKAAQKKQKKKPWQGHIKIAKEPTSAFEDGEGRQEFEDSIREKIKKADVGRRWGFAGVAQTRKSATLKM